MDDEIRFYLDLGDRVTGPVADDDVREALREGRLTPEARVRFSGSEVWASPRAFAAFARMPGASPPIAPAAPALSATSGAAPREVPPELAAMPQPLRDLLLFWLHEGARVAGPISGADLRRDVELGIVGPLAVASLIDSGAWYPAALVARSAPRRDPSAVPAVQPTRESSGSIPGVKDKRAPQRAIYLGAAAPPPTSAPSARYPVPSVAGVAVAGAGTTVRCVICLEQIAANLVTCPECGEPAVASPASMRGGPPSIPDLAPNASWLAMHWRPVVTIGVMATLVCTGITLRHLAPGRFAVTPRAGGKATAAATSPAACSAACWSGEACHEGRCEWRPPNDVGHVAAKAEPTVGGPFALPRDVSDALPLDSERFAISLLTGLQVHNARTGGVLGLVTDAPQARRLYRVGAVVYATAPQRIYVVDAATTRLLKTIETGAAVGEVTLGASGRRALASLPSAHAVAVLATEYHAEIDRIQFGDDLVGPMGADDTGKRALTTTGQVPLPGLRDTVGANGGAVYAFDPSRLASDQDRVRASMVGNPVSVLMTPDGETSYVVLRGEDALVPLAWQPSGAVRQEAHIPTCREPEQIELVRRGRLGVVRCNEGHAIEVFDLHKRELVRHVPFNARVADLAVSPDGKQAIVALPADGTGFVGIVDLETYAVKVLPLSAEPTRVRLSPDGTTALVLSDRAKVAWVIR